MERLSIDRRPVDVINCYGANYDTDPDFGLAAFWTDEATAIDTLIERIQDSYDAGYRRFVLNRPCGCCPGDVDGAGGENVVSNNVWGGMPAWKQTGLTTTFKTFWDELKATDPTVQLGIYAGWMLRDDLDLDNVCMDSSYHQPDQNDSADMDFVTDNWQDWIEIGVTFFGADNTATAAKWTKFSAFAQDWASGDFWGSSIKVASEGIPNVHHLPDQARIYTTAGMGLWRFIRSHENDSNQSWEVDPTRTEQAAGIANDNKFSGESDPVLATKSDLRSLMSRGFILWDWSSDDDVHHWIIELSTVPAVTLGVSSGVLNWNSADSEDDDGLAILADHYEVWRSSSGDEGSFEYMESVTDLDYEGTSGFFYYIVAVSELNAVSPPSNTVYVGDNNSNESQEENNSMTETESSGCPALLEAYNIVLRAANESPITTLETDTYTVALVEPVLDSVRRRILQEGWNFNSDCIQFTPDEEDQIVVPSTYFAVKFPDNLKERLTVRNGKVWDRSTQEYYSTAFKAEVRLDLAFCQLPPLAQQYIARLAACEFEEQVHGPSAAHALLTQRANKAKANLFNSEFCSFDGLIGFSVISGAYAL